MKARCKKYDRFGLLLVVVSLFSFAAFGDTLVIEKGASYPLRLASSVSYYLDHTRSMPIDTIVTSEFTRNLKNDISFGYVDADVWIKFDLLNRSGGDLANLFLEVDSPNLDYVDVYSRQSVTDVFDVIHTGDMRLFDSRTIKHPNVVVALDSITNNESTEMYIHMRTQGSTYANMYLWSLETFLKHDRNRQLIFGIYYGIMLIIVIYNSFLYLSLKDKSYIFYVLYIVSFNFTISNIIGLSNEYLLGQYPYINNIMLALFCFVTYCFMLLFTKYFLDLKQRARRINSYFNGLVLLSACFALLTPLMGYMYAIRIATILSFIIAISIFSSGIKMLKTFRPARYFVVAWTFFLVGIVLVSLRQWGILPETFLTNHGFQIGSALEVILLSVSLIDRIYALKQEKYEALKKINSKLKKLDTVKDDFLAKTSHELRTPLTGIIGIAESIYDRVNREVKGDLAILTNNARRLVYLVNDLLDTGSLKRGDISLDVKPTSLKAVVDSSLHLFAYSAEQKNIKIVNEIEHSAGNVLVDQDRFQQILQNLILNAIKFTHSGSIVVSALRQDSEIEISIKDTGKGIAVQDHERIFSSFEQASGSQGGTGLGLFISKHLVELHHGKIWVESTLGSGSIFKFTVPTTSLPQVKLVDALSRTTREEDYLIEKTKSASSHSILIVDDEALNLRVLNNHLSRYHVIAVTSGEEALVFLQKKKPDLILLDVMMPGLDGFQTCEQIRSDRSNADIPIIFVTAKNQVKDLRDGFAVGGDDYLPKPFLKGELLARVENQLNASIAAKRLTNLVEFSNKISAIRDEEELSLAIFHYLSQLESISNIVLFDNEKIVAKMNDSDLKELQSCSVESNPDSPISNPFESIYKLSLIAAENFNIVLKTKQALLSFEKRYIESLIKQSEIIRSNLASIYQQKHIPAYFFIFSKLKEIDCIKYKSGFIEVFCNDLPAKTFELSLKEIGMIFRDNDLLRVRKNFFVNPRRIRSIRKISRTSYELLTDQNNVVPIGKTYLKKVKSNYPHLFGSN